MSLGAYPNQPCYDPNRPSWLPYWIDDATEDECGTGTSNVLSAMWTTFTDPSLLASEVGTSAGEAAGSVASSAAGGVTGGFLQTMTTTGWLTLAAVGAAAAALLILAPGRR